MCDFCYQFCKQTRNGRWRAYAKGCIGLCERYSDIVVSQRANGTILTDVAPKDVKQLEVLRPHSALSMGQRHKRSLEKEKRLEAATKPVQSKKRTNSLSNSKKEKFESNDVEMKGSKTGKQKKKRHEKSSVNKLQDKGNASLDQADEVVEGINWSDEE